jgi:hypothetical protein
MTNDIKTQIKALTGSSVGTELTEQNVVMYCMRLAEIPPDELEVAIARVTDQCRFFPSIAEIKQAHQELYGMKRQAPRSAYDLGYLPRPTGPVAFDLPGVPTLSEIVAREEQEPESPLLLPALASGE